MSLTDLIFNSYSIINTIDFQSINLYSLEVAISMFLLFSPYSFLFLSIYMLFLLSLFSIGNFYYFWIAIEILMLIFIGLRYTLFVRSYSQLISYFLIQAIASFFLLIFYIYHTPILFSFSILLKLSIFPFFTWYINLIYRFPNFMFWLARTFHKVPLILIVNTFSLHLDMTVIWSSIFFTTFLRGLMMLRVLDFRMLLVLSSVGNNSWFLLRQMTNMSIFLLFVVIYSLRLFYLVNSFNRISKPSLSYNVNFISYKLSFWVLSLSGMPPFPVFYVKILVILYLGLVYGFNYMFLLFLIANSFMLMGYLQSIIKYYTYCYTSMSCYLLKY